MFAATFGAPGQDAFDEAQADSGRRGDVDGVPPDHGTPERNGAWFTQGGIPKRTAQDNTWLSAHEDAQQRPARRAGALVRR